MMIAKHCLSVFMRSVHDFHVHNNVDESLNNPYVEGTLEALLYAKNWIDTIQWHLEDLIRDPAITAEDALALKRRIDRRNVQRNNIVDKIDEHLFTTYQLGIHAQNGAKMNTESPARAIDRLSILALRIYHMNTETRRQEASTEHRQRCLKLLAILTEQQEDLMNAIDKLLNDIKSGKTYFKLYKQL